MKEYQFQYTKMGDTVIVMILTILTFVLSELLGIYIKVNIMLTIIISFAFSYFLFKALKGKVVRFCTAKLNGTSIEFEFENATKIINFDELTSYKSYYGKNGAVLYLKNRVDNFKIFANNNFCKTDDFKSFCEDTIIQLDKYRVEHNSTLIHEGSIFTSKGMFYFLISATSVYLLAFYVETKDVRIAIGTGGGFYLLIMWARYYIENKKPKE